MRLDRNEHARGKYALLNMRKMSGYKPDGTAYPMEVVAAVQLLHDQGLLEFGAVGSKNEFFAIKLRDVHSRPALIAYAGSALIVDPEYAREVRELSTRAGEQSRFCKDPD